MESEIPFPWQQEVIETFRAMPEQSGKSWLINYLKTLDAADQLVKTVGISDSQKEEATRLMAINKGAFVQRRKDLCEGGDPELVEELLRQRDFWIKAVGEFLFMLNKLPLDEAVLSECKKLWVEMRTHEAIFPTLPPSQ